MKKKIVFLVIILAVIAGGYLYLWQDAEFGGIERIKSYLLSFNLEAQLDEPKDGESQPNIEELTEEALSLGETEEISACAECAEATAGKEKTELTLEQIAQRVNEISEKVAAISAQAEQLSSGITLAQVKGATIIKGAPEEKTQPTLEEISEKLNEISEKVEMISAQAEQLLSG